MKLTPAQAKVIASTQLNAELPISSLRKKLGLRDHTIRYALDRARSQGIIERRYFINLFRLGYLQHEVFFSLSFEEKGLRDSLIAQLVKSDRTSWIGRLGGDFHYGINICSRDVSEMLEFFDQLSEKYGRTFLEKTLSLRVSLTYFGNRYLYPGAKPSHPLSYRITSERVEIDQLDHRILSALTAHGSSSTHQLARLLGLPQSTVDYRLKRLRSTGVIVGSYYSIKRERIGILSYLCLISTRGISSLFREKALAFCQQQPEIVLMIESIGSWDFEFVIDVTHAEDAVKISEKLLDLLGRDLNWVKMIPLFSYPKVHEYPFTTAPVGTSSRQQ